MIYRVPLVLSPQPDGGFTVTSPVLPELISEGDTSEEALDNVRDALEAVLEIYQDLDRPLPPEIVPTSTASPVILDTLITVS